MSSTTRILTPTQLRYIANTAAITSVVPVCAGLYGVLKPRQILGALEYPPPRPSDSASTATTLEVVSQMYAVRQLAFGLSNIIVWYHGDYSLMGTLALTSGLVVAVVDGIVAKRAAGKHVVGHWIGVGMSLVFGFTLSGFV